MVPDFYAEYPKLCMGGWGATHLVVSPDGRALPCPAALLLPLDFPKVTEVSLEEIWYYSEAFNLFRGTGWMQEPCRSCPSEGDRLRRLPVPGLHGNWGPYRHRSCVSLFSMERAMAVPRIRRALAAGS